MVFSTGIRSWKSVCASDRKFKFNQYQSLYTTRWNCSENRKRSIIWFWFLYVSMHTFEHSHSSIQYEYCHWKPLLTILMLYLLWHQTLVLVHILQCSRKKTEDNFHKIKATTTTNWCGALVLKVAQHFHLMP